MSLSDGIQYNFNSEHISALNKIDLLLHSSKTDDIYSPIIKKEVTTIKQRNKILKIADRHGWDTVNEYLDDPLADSVEDATKLRATIGRASRKRNTPKPYSRGGGKGGFNANGFFRGFNQGNTQRFDNFSEHNTYMYQKSNNDGLCFYCKRPGHIAHTNNIQAAATNQ